jgi:hypothetical protein
VNHLSLDLPEAPGEGGNGKKAVDAKHYSYVLIGDLRWIGIWLRIPWGLMFKGDFGADLRGVDPEKCMRCDRSKPSSESESESEDADSGHVTSLLGKCGKVCCNVFCGADKEKKASASQPKQEADNSAHLPPLGMVQAVPRGQCMVSTPFVQVFVALPGFCSTVPATVVQVNVPTPEVTRNPLILSGPSAAELQLELTRLRAINSDNIQKVEILRVHAASQQLEINSMRTELQHELGRVNNLSASVGQLEKSLEESVLNWVAAEAEHKDTVVNVRRASVAAIIVGQAPVSMQHQALRRLSLAVATANGSERDDGTGRPIAPPVLENVPRRSFYSNDQSTRGPQSHEARL